MHTFQVTAIGKISTNNEGMFIKSRYTSRPILHRIFGLLLFLVGIFCSAEIYCMTQILTQHNLLTIYKKVNRTRLQFHFSLTN